MSGAEQHQAADWGLESSATVYRGVAQDMADRATAMRATARNMVLLTSYRERSPYGTATEDVSTRGNPGSRRPAAASSKLPIAVGQLGPVLYPCLPKQPRKVPLDLVSRIFMRQVNSDLWPLVSRAQPPSVSAGGRRTPSGAAAAWPSPRRPNRRGPERQACRGPRGLRPAPRRPPI